jgi:nucleoside phosphorylase
LLIGVGNYNVIYTLQDYLTKNEIDFVVNIGVCGVKKETNKKLVQVYRIKNLASEKEALMPIYFQLGELVSLGSSEKIITNQESI